MKIFFLTLPLSSLFSKEFFSPNPCTYRLPKRRILEVPYSGNWIVDPTKRKRDPKLLQWKCQSSLSLTFWFRLTPSIGLLKVIELSISLVNSGSKLPGLFWNRKGSLTLMFVKSKVTNKILNRFLSLLCPNREKSFILFNNFILQNNS